jgi:hypothetical protein
MHTEFWFEDPLGNVCFKDREGYRRITKMDLREIRGVEMGINRPGSCPVAGFGISIVGPWDFVSSVV